MSLKGLLSFAIAAAGTTGLAKSAALRKRKRALAAFLASGERHAFAAVARPRASIVIPVYNGAHHTLQCLLSILHLADGSFEVLVVDDGSSDETTELLSRFENIRVEHNPKNLGFLRTANAGAKAAKGKFLVFLNNDARLVSGSLSAALDLFENEKNCGAMGARVVHVNGGLQEAGCMIYQNGITNGYLRYYSENDPLALYQRDVDYCSGVFTIVERRQFLALGGFDEIYAPAYFEETDLSMRLRKVGLRFIYNPRLLVDHFEFGSSAKASTARQKIEDRRKIFLDRWQNTLREQKFLALEQKATIERAAMRLLRHPRVLYILTPQAAAQFDIETLAKIGNAVTVYVLDGKLSLLRQLIAKADMKVEFAFGNTNQLLRLAKQRLGIYGKVEATADIDPRLVLVVRELMGLSS